MQYCSICRKVLVEVGEDIALDAHVFHVKGNTRGGDGIQTRGMVHEIGGKGAALDLLGSQISCELIENGGNDLQMRQLFRAHVGENPRYLVIRTGIALVQIAHGSGKLAVGTARLKKDIIKSHIKEQFDSSIGFVEYDLVND